jgi:hypothetical protein
VSPQDRVAWVEEFLVLDGEAPAAQAIAQLEHSTARWIVITRGAGHYVYAFTRDELWRWPALRVSRERVPDWTAQPLVTVLDLHETQQSTPVQTRVDPPAIDRSWRPDETAPTVARYVQLDASSRPLAVGSTEIQMRQGRGPRARPPAPPLPPPSPRAGEVRRPEFLGVDTSEEPGVSVTAGTIAPLEDEGTTPVRYPSITAERDLTPGEAIAITVDLLREQAAHTSGQVSLGPQAEDWHELPLAVILSCPQIAFEHEGRGTVTVRRNASSIAATITGTVITTAQSGDIVPITALFFHETRFCGSALRAMSIGPAGPVFVSSAPSGTTRGTIVPQPAAAQPDVTVRISREGQNQISWLLQTARFDGLPAKLRETIVFDRGVDAEIAALFKTFASLTPGQHVTTFEGFGTQLWNRAPRMFRTAYWALWDHYQRPLTFQFITNEPNLPWELMRPAREDESEVHVPLALVHPVARWLEDYDGYMRNQLPPGRIFTIAPKYSTVSRRLPRAQSESALIVQQFGATALPGTRAALLQVLETLPPAEPVALLHFAGHGQFMPSATTQSSIKLEDGALTASEVSRPEVRLGKACRTLVFFNACEVGAAGSIFGEVGGWAAAFLSRQFGGFIAPLWSVEDDDAGRVAEELLQGIVTRREPIGAVLRDIRSKHGSRSPTYYSYLYYGDVTALLAK